MNRVGMKVIRGADPEFVGVQVSWIDDHGFSGEFETDGVASAFSNLAASLRSLHQNLAETCSWSIPYEDNVRFEFTGDGRGHVEVTVELIPDHLAGPWVRSTIQIDQTELPPIIRSAEEAAGI